MELEALSKKRIQRIILTDLDGSLLDHETYSYGYAKDLLLMLEKIRIPVIPVTSKTFSEVVKLRNELNNKHPFITENGAGIYIPKSYFKQIELNWKIKNDYFFISDSYNRDFLVDAIQSHAHEFLAEFKTFHALNEIEGIGSIAKVTGLCVEDAQLASEREFSEVVIWLSTEKRRKLFADCLEKHGLLVQQGGRFLNITGQSTKGGAVQKLIEIYCAQPNIDSCDSLAIGDSQNDISMLEIADQALIIKPLKRKPLKINKRTKVSISQEIGPRGWVSGVTDWLQNFN